MSKQVSRVINSVDEFSKSMDWVLEMARKGLRSGPVKITLGRQNKSRDQESKYHAMIGDIQKQCFRGYSIEGVKAVLVNQFAQEMEQAGEPLSSPGERVWDWKSEEPVYVRPSTKRFKKAEAAQFIEFLNSVGAEYDVKWSDASLSAYDDMSGGVNG